MEETFDIVVVGNGLIGSAAARYLGDDSNKVALLGIAEPLNWAKHQGVFASHYDEGRITRIIDQNPVWSELARRSIAEYSNIQNFSGINFFNPVGCLQGGSKGRMSGEVWKALNQAAETNRLKPELLEGEEIHTRYFFSQGHGQAILETGTAGHINPRALIQAQNRMAIDQGVQIIEDSVLGLRNHDRCWLLKTEAGRSFTAKKVLLATGAFTNGILWEPLPMSIFPRTVLFARVTEEMKENLGDMPCIIWDLEPGFDYVDMYLLPPITYPDGNDYIKIGGDAPGSATVENQQELKEWFRMGGSSNHAEGLKKVLLDLMPILSDMEFHHKPCVTTNTSSGYPLIDELEDGSLFVACAGCGLAAKSSNELGRLAATMVLGTSGSSEPEDSPLDFKIFRLPAETSAMSEILN